MIKKIIVSNSFLSYLAISIRKLAIRKKYNLKFGKNVFLGFNVITEGNNYFAENSFITGSSIGYGSYLGANTNISKAKIGRYCSIGPRVNCVFGKHPTDTFVSTHPIFFSTNKQMGFSYTDKALFEEYSPCLDPENKYSILIGNDVWIGANVTIMDGVSIGDGAIVASNALVNKNVAPFSIVGGLPAKHIKNRFTKEHIDFLLKLKWWNKKESWVRDNAHLFVNIDFLYNKYKDEYS